MFEGVLFVHISVRDTFVIANVFEVRVFFTEILDKAVKIYLKIEGLKAGGADVADINEDVSVIF